MTATATAATATAAIVIVATATATAQISAIALSGAASVATSAISTAGVEHHFHKGAKNLDARSGAPMLDMLASQS